ncbi:MAG: DUF3015 domain-containing protein [Deltaproteobacteria bacterium]|nr:DUF3015 domain-containing protein [Deltaproteobacteria bacterium]
MKKIIITFALLLLSTSNCYAQYKMDFDFVDYLITTTCSPTLSSMYTTDQNKGYASLDRFVADNLNDLAIDIAKGSGEYIEALAEIKQISGNDKDKFFASLKSNFDTIFPSVEVDHKYVIAEINRISGV